MTAPRDCWSDRQPAALTEHDALSTVLLPDDRAWLADMADVLPWGWVIPGMETPPRGAVVTDDRYPGGVRVVVPPSGPAGASGARR